MNNKELILRFIEENDLSVRSIEAGAKMPQGTINLSKGYIPEKHIGALMEYLESEYGYISAKGDVVIDNPGVKFDTTVVYNKGLVYYFGDMKPRVQDEHGLWRRVEISCNEGDSGIKLIDGVEEEDEKGFYLNAADGIRVYIRALDRVKKLYMPMDNLIGFNSRSYRIKR